MRLTVEAIDRDRIRNSLLLTLCIHAPAGERVQLYRVKCEEYESFGELTIGDTLDIEDVLPLIEEEEISRAYARALRILGTADNTAQALERKLIGRGFVPSCARAAVERIVREGYLREEDMLLRQFAVFQKRLWGPGKYLPALLSKGFSRELIERARDKAKEEEVYDADAVKRELLSRFSPKGEAERRALLYKYGFRA